MQNHLELHHLEHAQRMKQAEKERLGQQVIAEGKEPNPALMQLGNLLIDAGHHIQQQAKPRVNYAG